jgi:hypothetical protein
MKVIYFIIIMTITAITFCAYFLSWNKTRISMCTLESLVSYCVDVWSTFFPPLPSSYFVKLAALVTLPLTKALPVPIKEEAEWVSVPVGKLWDRGKSFAPGGSRTLMIMSSS